MSDFKFSNKFGTSSIYFSISTNSSIFLLCLVIPLFISSTCLNTEVLISCDFLFKQLISNSFILACLFNKVSLTSLQFTLK